MRFPLKTILLIFLFIFTSEEAWSTPCLNLDTPKKLIDAINGNCTTISVTPEVDCMTPTVLYEDAESNPCEYLNYISDWSDFTIKPKDLNSDVMLWIQFQKIFIDSVTFTNVIPIFQVESSITNTSFTTYSSDYSAIFKGLALCGVCDSYNAGFKVESGGYFIVGSISGQKGRAFSISGENGQIAGKVYILGYKFHSQSSSPYIWVNAADFVSSYGNQFTINSAPIIKVDAEVGFSPIVIFREGKIFKNGTGSLDLNNLFTAGNDTKMHNLGKPSFEYVGYDDEYFRVKVVTPMTTQTWGEQKIACNGTFYSKHVNIEPYYLVVEDSNIRSAHSLGLRAPIKEGNDFYLKIKRNTSLYIGELGKTTPVAKFDQMKDIPIAIVAHCEGSGSTFFSDQINLKICDANEEYNLEIKDCQTLLECGKNKDCPQGKMCVSNFCKECAVDSDCKEQKLCKLGVCTEPPQCASDLECDYGEICQNQQCATKPIVACSTDADCSADEYCAGTAKGCLPCTEAQPVGLICPGASYTGHASTEEGKCPDGKDPICPVNSGPADFCGGGCFCNDGYRSVGGQACVDKLTSRVCPMGYVLNSTTQECMLTTLTQRAGKKGGCSLIR